MLESQIRKSYVVLRHIPINRRKLQNRCGEVGRGAIKRVEVGRRSSRGGEIGRSPWR